MSSIEVTSFQEDQLNLQPFCERFERFLLVERDFVEGSLVVSLNAPFGSGKTTFLKMWRNDLLKRREEVATTLQPILLNAWENDFCGDPLLAIVAGLVRALESDKPTDGENPGSKLREAAKDIAWFISGLANSLASHLTGLDPIAAADFAEAKKADRKLERPDFVSVYEQRVDALTRLKSAIRDAFSPETRQALVMVDELDRCRPDYAVTYLETIKHIFDVSGLIFVLAIDYHHLENSAKAVFGGELKFAEYLRRFVHRVTNLPKPDEQATTRLAVSYTRAFLEREGKRKSLLELHTSTPQKSIAQIAGGFQLSPRQIQEMFRIIGHALTRTEDQDGRLYWCIGVGTTLLAALKMLGAPEYHEVGLGIPSSHSNFGRLLIARLGKKKALWWFQVYITGAASEGERIDIPSLFVELGFIEDSPDQRERLDLGQFESGWGDIGTGMVRRIYAQIESLKEF